MPCLFPPSRSRPHSNMAQSVSAHAPPLARASHPPRARGLIFVGFQRLKKRRTCHIFQHNVYNASPNHYNNVKRALLLLITAFICNVPRLWTIKTVGRNIKRFLCCHNLFSRIARRLTIILVYLSGNAVYVAGVYNICRPASLPFCSVQKVFVLLARRASIVQLRHAEQPVPLCKSSFWILLCRGNSDVTFYIAMINSHIAHWMFISFKNSSVLNKTCLVSIVNISNQTENNNHHIYYIILL